jgi:hypothetical protein
LLNLSTDIFDTIHQPSSEKTKNAPKAHEMIIMLQQRAVFVHNIV